MSYVRMRLVGSPRTRNFIAFAKNRLRMMKEHMEIVGHDDSWVKKIDLPGGGHVLIASPGDPVGIDNVEIFMPTYQPPPDQVLLAEAAPTPEEAAAALPVTLEEGIVEVPFFRREKKVLEETNQVDYLAIDLYTETANLPWGYALYAIPTEAHDGSLRYLDDPDMVIEGFNYETSTGHTEDEAVAVSYTSTDFPPIHWLVSPNVTTHELGEYAGEIYRAAQVVYQEQTSGIAYTTNPFDYHTDFENVSSCSQMYVIGHPDYGDVDNWRVQLKAWGIAAPDVISNHPSSNAELDPNHEDLFRVWGPGWVAIGERRFFYAGSGDATVYALMAGRYHLMGWLKYNDGTYVGVNRPEGFVKSEYILGKAPFVALRDAERGTLTTWGTRQIDWWDVNYTGSSWNNQCQYTTLDDGTQMPNYYQTAITHEQDLYVRHNLMCRVVTSEEEKKTEY